MLTRVLSDSIEVEEWLAAMGLTEEWLRDAVRMGEAARSACTANDPPPFAGQTAWARTVRGLREKLLPRGWKRNSQQNFCTVVNPDGNFRIAVATGDESVGVPAAEPKTKNARGPLMETAVARNSIQYELDLGHIEAPAGLEDRVEDEAPVREDCKTWLLLFHRTEQEVRCELSLPAGFGENMRVDSWKVRIILASIEIDPAPNLPITDSGPDIDIPVVRKQT